MIKLYRFIVRRLDMTHNEAIRFYTESYAPLLVNVLGDSLVRYSTNICLPNQLDENEPPEAPLWDGVDEIWLDTEVDEAKEIFAKQSRVLLPSEREFIGNAQWMLVDEVMQRDDRDRSYKFKILEPLWRRRDQTWNEFIDFWLNKHVPLVKEVYGDGVVRYMTNLGLGNPFNWRMPTEGPLYDGVAEFYLAWTLDEYKEAMDEHASALIADEVLLLSSWRLAFVEEILQKGSW